MEGFGGLFGDPDELQRRMAEFAEQLQGQQRLAWADNAIKLAVDITVAAINRINLQGNAEQQAQQIRSVMAVVFPEAVTLVRERAPAFSSAGAQKSSSSSAASSTVVALVGVFVVIGLVDVVEAEVVVAEEVTVIVIFLGGAQPPAGSRLLGEPALEVVSCIRAA